VFSARRQFFFTSRIFCGQEDAKSLVVKSKMVTLKKLKINIQRLNTCAMPVD
jgi:hypothetical protein